MPSAPAVISSVIGAWRRATGTVSPTYIRAPGTAAANPAPPTARAASSHPMPGATTAATPASEASSSASRMVRTRPSRSETTAHTACITP